MKGRSNTVTKTIPGSYLQHSEKGNHANKDKNSSFSSGGNVCSSVMQKGEAERQDGESNKRSPRMHGCREGGLQGHRIERSESEVKMKSWLCFMKSLSCIFLMLCWSTYMAPHMSRGFNYAFKRVWLEINQAKLNLWAAAHVSLVFHWIDSSDCSENMPE